MYAKYWILGTHIMCICFLQDLARAHLGESCNLGVCLTTILMPIKNAYCDSTENKCKCEKGFVAVGPHRCAQVQSYNRPCDHDNVCRYRDENMFCDKTRASPACECRKSFQFDLIQKKCIPQVKKPKSTPLFPITAVILIACVGIFCGCGIICHNFRRQPELSISVEQVRRTQRNPSGGQTRTGSHSQNSSNDSTESPPHPLLRSDSRSSSSKYDSLIYDDPPPKYEDAIKDYPSEMTDSPINIPPIVVIKS